mgnify:CR=1 FL=1
MKYYSQYHSHELFELQESLSGLSKSQPLGEACRQSSLGQDRAGMHEAPYTEGGPVGDFALRQAGLFIGFYGICI